MTRISDICCFVAFLEQSHFHPHICKIPSKNDANAGLSIAFQNSPPSTGLRAIPCSKDAGLLQHRVLYLNADSLEAAASCSVDAVRP